MADWRNYSRLAPDPCLRSPVAAATAVGDGISADPTCDPFGSKDLELCRDTAHQRFRRDPRANVAWRAAAIRELRELAPVSSTSRSITVNSSAVARKVNGTVRSDGEVAR